MLCPNFPAPIRRTSFGGCGARGKPLELLLNDFPRKSCSNFVGWNHNSASSVRHRPAGLGCHHIRDDSRGKSSKSCPARWQRRHHDRNVFVFLQCSFYTNASSDEEFGSSRNIAISLLKRYRYVIDRGGGDNLKEFISAGVNAYALGCTENSLREELVDLKKSDANVTFKILHEEIEECILWTSLVFITILCTPQLTVIRWSSTPPVSTEILHDWKGFCALIANAYYTRGMAWLPVKTLQLEQMAVMGQAEEPSVVASRMRLVFGTLEVVSPQWPRV